MAKNNKTMKKFSYLLMAAFAVMTVCSSCSKDEEDGGKVDSKSLVGTWRCVSEEGYEIYDGEKEEWKDTYNNPNEYWGIIFNADGTGVTYDYYNGEEYEDNFTWKLSGNKLTIKHPEESDADVGTIESLTSKQLVTVYEWVSADGKEKEYEKATFTRVK